MLHYVSSTTAATMRSMADFDHELIVEPGQTRIGLAHSLIPKTFYLVRNGINQFMLDGTTFTVPAGNYGVDTFRTAVNTLIAPATLTLNHSTGKWLILSSATQISFPVGVSESLHKLFGFDKHSTNLFVAGQLASTNCIMFQRAPVAHILCSGVYDKSSGAFDDLLGTVNMTGNDFSFISYTNPEIFATSKPLLSPNKTDSDVKLTLKFSIVDEEGDLLDTNGVPVSLNIVTYNPDPTLTKLFDLFKNYAKMRTQLIQMQLSNETQNAK